MGVKEEVCGNWRELSAEERANLLARDRIEHDDATAVSTRDGWLAYRAASEAALRSVHDRSLPRIQRRALEAAIATRIGERDGFADMERRAALAELAETDPAASRYLARRVPSWARMTAFHATEDGAVPSAP